MSISQPRSRRISTCLSRLLQYPLTILLCCMLVIALIVFFGLKEIRETSELSKKPVPVQREKGGPDTVNSMDQELMLLDRTTASSSRWRLPENMDFDINPADVEGWQRNDSERNTQLFKTDVDMDDPEQCGYRIIGLRIREDRTDEGVVFSLEGIEVKHMNLRFSLYMPSRYSPSTFYGAYVLATYDSNGKVINKYSITSGRFIYSDYIGTDPKVKSGMLEWRSGTRNVHLYDNGTIYAVRVIGGKRGAIPSDVWIIGPEVRRKRALILSGQY